MSIRGFKYFLALALTFAGSLLYSQPGSLPEKSVIFDQLPQILGVNQRSVNCVLQDRDGFLWIGTWSGLIKYDGYQTKIYTHNNSDHLGLKSHKITAIAEDSQGLLWFGTRIGGLFRFDKHKEQFTQFAHAEDDPNSLSNNNVWDVIIDSTDNIWVSTEYGLNFFDPKTESFYPYTTKDGLSDNFIRSIHLDKNGKLWAATEKGTNAITIEKDYSINVKQLKFEADKDTEVLHNYAFDVGSITVDGKQQVYTATQKGLKKWDGEHYRNFEMNDRPSSFSYFRSLLIIPGENPFVILGSELGLSLFDIRSEKFTKIYADEGDRLKLSHSSVKCIYLDHSDVLWVGTKKGINKYDTYDKNFQLFKNSEFDPTESIITGITGTKEHLWISTLGGGVFRFNKKTKSFQSFHVDDTDANDFSDYIQEILMDKNGYVWLGTAGAGVIKFDPNKSSNKDGLIRDYIRFARYTKHTISDIYVMSMFEGKEGIWVGTWSGGLNLIKPNNEVIKYNSGLFVQAPIVELVEDKSSVLWIGSRGNGLYRVLFHEDKIVKTDEFRADDQDLQSLSNNFISTIIPASSNNLWIGTENGLNHLDISNYQFTQYKKSNGLLTNEAIALKTDINGNLWIGHWEGLTAVRPTSTGLEVINHYDEEDRIQGGFFYNNHVYEDKKGILYFAGSNGFNIINPQNLITNPHKPKTAILDIAIFDQSLKVGESYDGQVILKESVNQTSSIELKHFQNSIKIEFSANHFAAPNKNNYAYMLEGFDEDWQYTSSLRRFCNYTNVPDGAYVFKLKSSNNDGTWDEQPVEMVITILPPWWRTTWAYVGYAFISLLFLMLFRKLIIIRTNYANSILFERMEKENIQKHNRAKLEFFTNISHEFRTPLTLILGPLQNLAEAVDGDKFIKQQLGIIDRNTTRLLRLINQLLDFRKAESGKLKLQVAAGNFVKFVQEIKLSFDALATDKSITFNLHCSSNIINLWFDRDQFEKVLYNLLSNAFKHTPTGGQIDLKIIEKKESVVVVVEDTGEGINADDLNKVFERFYSNETTLDTGTGIGLALTKNLVNLHHGTITVDSRESEFTRFSITLPKGSDHFEPHEILQNFADSEQIDNYQSHFETDTEDIEIDHPAHDITTFDRILIVEDNKDVREFVKSIFIEDFIVFEAVDGEEGITIAEEEIPDIIISDVMMPVMDGISMCKHLKESTKTSHIPIVLLTARTSLIYHAQGLENEADDYITKPFDAKLLKLRVLNLIKSRKKLQKLFSQPDKLIIEPKNVTVTSSDEIFVKNALESIENNMSSSEYTVEDLGRDVGLSRMQLYRKLKAMTGLSANEFIRSIRLKRAAQLIVHNEFTIAEITYQVGFSDLQYFRKCFKKQFGCNPSEYHTESETEEAENSQID